MSQNIVLDLRPSCLDFACRRVSDRHTNLAAASPRERTLPDGTTIIEWLSVAGQLHREPDEGPALIILYPSGEVMEESYCVHDRFHRLNGPAVIEYDETGGVYAEESWLEGLQLQRRLVGRRAA